MVGERSNVGTCMKDVLGKIIANRPEDPIAFMADYFDSLEEQTSLVARARQLIIMTHHSRPVFDINVRMAYETLQKSKCNKKLHGVNGTVYNELIRALCRIVESGYNLGPDGLFHILDKAMKRDTHISTAFTLEMFTAECCEAFIAKVKKLR
ncbi:TPGS1 [Mytilus coruscus]|uniref:TPGS1 n=1 Tax=Mytilus coruscus TaxID=42192 RepID=A0A6J8D8Q0_MYTCO|nr:TPGS1 [Mytilus coruscus]